MLPLKVNFDVGVRAVALATMVEYELNAPAATARKNGLSLSSTVWLKVELSAQLVANAGETPRHIETARMALFTADRLWLRLKLSTTRTGLVPAP